MNFKDSYKKEMDLIKKPADITQRALEQNNISNKRNFSHSVALKTAIATIALMCIIGGTLQHDKIMSFAESIFGIFTLSANNEKLGFGEIKTIQMDVEKFITDSGTKIVLDADEKAEPPYNYYQYFDSYKDMNQVTNIVFPCADKVEYREISVDLIPEEGCGHISAQIIYNDVSYNVNGMYAIEGFEQESWGYGVQDAKTVERYQYGKNKNACFIEDSDGIEVVYFNEENILFQMYFHNGNSIKNGDATATRKQCEKLLKLFGQS